MKTDIYMVKINQFENTSKHATLEEAKKRVHAYFPYANFVEITDNSNITIYRDNKNMEQIGEIIK